MKKKICVVVLLLLIACVVMSACNMEKTSPPVYVKAPGGSYRVLSTVVDSQYSGVAAPQGMTYLLITVGGGNSDVEDIGNTFFGIGKTPCKVSNGSVEAECSRIAYGEKQNKDGSKEVLATLVFEVPADFSGSFTLSANEAEPVTLEYKAPASK